jgi:patatin-like phospholipase/acyl hydrolase
LYFLSQDDDAFYKSVSTESNYGSAKLKSVITSQFGTRTLQDLNTNVLITSMNDTTKKFIMNSNVIDANFSNQSSLISDVALATSAAPIYLPPHVVNQQELIDGGVYQNSPARLGLSLGRRLKPLAKRACVMSIGTGQGDYGFDYELQRTLANPVTANAFYEELNSFYQTNTASTLSLPFENSIKKIFSLFDKASAGAEESVHKGFSLEAEPIGMTNIYYYRFQVELDKERETELDNTTPEIFDYYRTTAQNKYAQDSEKIATFLSHLLT